MAAVVARSGMTSEISGFTLAPAKPIKGILRFVAAWHEKTRLRIATRGAADNARLCQAIASLQEYGFP